MVEETRFCLILVYYDRPQMVRNALESIRDQDYSNWFLTFIDDGSNIKGWPVVHQTLGGYDYFGELSGGCNVSQKFDWTTTSKNIIAYRINDSPEDKAAQNGSRHPEFMNKSILAEGSGGWTDNDVVIILCCDDALFPGALRNLNEYYKANPSVTHSYSSVAVYDPLVERPDPSFKDRPFWLNHGCDVPGAYCKVDSTQVQYRRSVFTQNGFRYPSPAWRALDAAIYSQLDQLGPCRFNGIIAQYKGSHSSQLSYRISEEDIYSPKDTEII